MEQIELSMKDQDIKYSPTEVPENNEENFDVDKEEEEAKKKAAKKLLVFDVKPVSVCTLYWTLSDKLDVFYMCLALIGSFGSGVGMPLFAYLFGGTMSNFGSGSNMLSTIGTMVRDFLIVGAAMFVAYLLNVGLWLLVAKRQVHKMKQMYFSLIMRQEQGWFDANNAYEFSTKVQAQIKQVEGGLGEKFGMIVMGLTQFVAGMIISLTTSWKLTLVLLSVLPCIAISAVCMTRSLRNGMAEARKAYEKAGGIAEEVLYNIKTVASFGNFGFEINKYNVLVDECRKKGVQNSVKLGLGMGFIYFFLFATYCIAIVYGGRLIVNHEWNSNRDRYFDSGDVITVLFASVMAAASLGQIAPNMKAIAEACVAASDFFQLRERVPEIDTSTSNLKPSRDKITGKIEFSDISFAYPSKPDQLIIKNIDLTFEPGKKVAIVGESGSGKSTIVNLLERLYDPTGGNITIDGISIKDFDVKYLRSLIGYVQQEPVLFNRSIKENIIFGREELLDELARNSSSSADQLIKEACDDAYASEFINKIDGKHDYIVGIKGSKLSGGQKQRVAIARAILSKPKILLLDEATSALDNKSEKEVQHALDQICQKDVTTIIIAHRLSTIKNADKIIAIKKGEIQETGTHQELLKKDGYYASLVKSQMCAEDLQKMKQDDIERNASLEPVQSTVRSQTENDEGVALNENHETNEQIPVEEEDVPQIDRGKLFHYLKNNKCDIFFASLGAAANGAIFPIYGLLLASSISVLSDTKDTTKLLHDGLFYAMMFLLIAGTSGISTFLQHYKYGVIGESLTGNMRSAVFEKYLRLHLSYFDKHENSPGALLTKLSLDTTLMNGLVLTVVGITTQTVVNIVLGVVLGFVYEWRLALIALGFLPFIIMSAYFQQKLRKGLSEGDDKADIEAGSILSECVINTKTIFSYNFEKTGINMYMEVLDRTKGTFCYQSFMNGFLFGIGQFAIFASYSTLFYASSQFFQDTSIHLNFSDMVKSIMTILFAAFGIGIAQQYMGDLAQARNAFISLFKTINTKSQIDTNPAANEGKRSAKDIKGKIEFRNVSFSYPTRPQTPILKNVSFTIMPGQSAALVGYSGCGKSTIIQLLERFYDATEGEILIDDVNITEYNLLELRKKIGLVAQEPCLFKRDVKENIRYGKLEANDAEIMAAAEKANIMKFFTSKDNGTKDSPVSGGEKQRIAIARVFLKDPVIMLFDEATSALDKESENEVQKALDILKGGKSSITIAHRLSTVENSDIIFVFDSGVIVERGSHAELYKKRGRYYTLHKYSS